MKQSSTIIMGGVAVVLIVGSALICGGGGYLYARFRIDRYDGLIKGREFGKTTDQRGCFEESLRRAREEKANTTREKYNKGLIHFFTSGCFETCQPTPKFCEEAPVNQAYQTISYWASAKCRSNGLAGNVFCENAFHDLVKECRSKQKVVSYPD